MIKKIVLLAFLAVSLYATAGYETATTVKKGDIKLDLTWNPFDMVEEGQSYVVWNYGITDNLEFHGFYSHQVSGTENIYAGLVYKFFSNKKWDFATAIGKRYVNNSKDETYGELEGFFKPDTTIHYFFPQFMYSYKMDNGMYVGGSIVHVTESFLGEEVDAGRTYEMTLIVPLYDKNNPSQSYLPLFFKDFKGIKKVEFAAGMFRYLAGNWFPAYSIDITF